MNSPTSNENECKEVDDSPTSDENDWNEVGDSQLRAFDDMKIHEFRTIHWANESLRKVLQNTREELDTLTKELENYKKRVHYVCYLCLGLFSEVIDPSMSSVRNSGINLCANGINMHLCPHCLSYCYKNDKFKYILDARMVYASKFSEFRNSAVYENIYAPEKFKRVMRAITRDNCQHITLEIADKGELDFQ